VNIDQASNLVNSGESAIVLFTREPPGSQDALFYIRPDKSGWSGNWVIAPDLRADKVIIYYRPPGRGTHYGEIFMARYEDTVPSPTPKRYRIKFQGVEQVGTTTRNWLDFAGQGQPPTGLISKK
jgi:hypothetical protein